MSEPARVALRVVLAALVPIMIGCAHLAPELMSMRPTLLNPHARTASSSVAADLTPPHFSEAPRPGDPGDTDIDVDLYGNDVTDAVAKYKLDSDGSLYELHSPQTQLPHLGSPKS